MRSNRAPTFSALRIAICILLPLIGLALLVGGLHGVVSFGLVPVLETLRTRAWVPADASVEEVGMRTPRWPLHRGFASIETRFRYQHEGVDFLGVRYDPHNGLVPAAAAATAVVEMETTPAMTVWINPRKPSQAIVHRELRPQVLLLTVPSLLLAVGGAMVLYRGMVAWTRELPDPAVDSGHA